jgi:5-methylthioadenosine/S-adenosylhomocysteine deaminase
MGMATLIRNADWAIAWDAASDRHVYRRDVDVAFDADELTHVGPGYAGRADTLIDGRGLMVMPGLVDVHSHPGREPAYRGIREEHGVPGMHMTGLYERMQAFAGDDEAMRAACSEFAYCELLKSGVTSLLDIGPGWGGWAALMAKSGLRAWLAPGFSSARWKMESPSKLGYAWDEKGDRQRLDAALKLVDGAARDPSGRLSGVLCPMQIDTCTEALLRDSLAAAKERKMPFTVHIAQGVTEYIEMMRRHGKSPIQWAQQIGVLGPQTILGHAIFLDSHSWVREHTGTSGDEDLALLAASGATVAHCPTPFARYGSMLESFGGYLRAGVNMAIGTDTTPHNMLEEMRTAVTLARIASRDIHSVSTADILHAATVGGAKALGRDDIGRLAPGKKADLVVVDLQRLDMMPARDPLRSLMYYAADRAVRDVFIDGRQVVAEGRVLTLDQEAAAARLAGAQERMMAEVPKKDYRGRSAEEITPLSLPVRRTP